MMASLLSTSVCLRSSPGVKEGECDQQIVYDEEGGAWWSLATRPSLSPMPRPGNMTQPETHMASSLFSQSRWIRSHPNAHRTACYALDWPHSIHQRRSGDRNQPSDKGSESRSGRCYFRPPRLSPALALTSHDVDLPYLKRARIQENTQTKAKILRPSSAFALTFVLTAPPMLFPLSGFSPQSVASASPRRSESRRSNSPSTRATLPRHCLTRGSFGGVLYHQHHPSVFLGTRLCCPLAERSI